MICLKLLLMKDLKNPLFRFLEGTGNRQQSEYLMSEVRDFKDLKVWQKGMIIAEKCYVLTQKFPKEEIYGMVQQIRRSATSIPANIAEGYGRRSTGDYVRFLNIAQGSINELETHLILSARVNLCNFNDIESIIDELKQESKMIISLIKKLKS